MKNDHLEHGSELWKNVLAWLRANGVRPEDVPVDPTMTLDGDRLTTDIYLLGEDGKRMLTVDGMAMQRTVTTFTVTVPPAADVAKWLAGGAR